MAKNPWIAVILSLAVSGLGQIYAGYYWRGLYLILGELATGFVYMYYSQEVGSILNLGVSVFAVVDAYHITRRTQQEKPPVEESEKQPEVRVF